MTTEEDIKSAEVQKIETLAGQVTELEGEVRSLKRDLGYQDVKIKRSVGKIKSIITELEDLIDG